MTRLALVRHGETIWHAENRYAGSTDIRLNPRGLEQAERLAIWAATADLAAIWVSPLRRARETAAPSERATGIAACVDDRLREIHFGEAEGLTNSEIMQSFPDAFAAFQSDPVAHHLPDGEDPRDVVRRAMECFNEIQIAHPRGRVLVVTHNTVIRLALCQLLGVPLSKYRSAFPVMANGALSEIRLHNGEVSLLKLNSPLESDVAALTQADEADAPDSSP
ncbi:MAG TPA: histidine phosphatase family protein [Terriglobales bacterium]|nr:histidine phosphatase family protein [Terriglobales bacterium]